MLEKLVGWDGSVSRAVRSGCFKGSIVFDAGQADDPHNYVYTDPSDSFLVLLSGNIYNTAELARRCGKESGKLSKPELILHLFLHDRENFPGLLNGDFGLVIIDQKAESIHLFRDHAGIHPLSYIFTGNHLYFSTDLPALSKACKGDSPVNCMYLLNQIGFEHRWKYSQTPHREVHRLLPGHFLKIAGHHLAVGKYWKPEEIGINRRLTWEQVYADLREILHDAVKIRVNKGVQCAAHVSGGLDSGIVAAYARQECAQQPIFNGYSWSSPSGQEEEGIRSEVCRTRHLCNLFQIVPWFQELTVDEYLTYLSNWRFELYIYHELKVLEKAKENKDKLIFSGWGGDEFISINTDGIDSDLFFGLKWGAFLKKNRIRTLRKLSGVLVHRVFFPLIARKYRSHDPRADEISKYIKAGKSPAVRDAVNLGRWRSRREVHLKLLYNYHIPARTENLFNMGLRHGVEYRFPLLDKRIIEYMLSVPSELLFRDGYTRRVLRELSGEFLSQEMCWTDQKSEPGLYRTDKELQKAAAEAIVAELPLYAGIPEFEIFDFEAIRRDIDLYRKGKLSFNDDNLLVFLGVLKKRYEFVKAFRNNQPV